MGVWGEVLRAPTEDEHVTAVRIESAGGGAYLILTREQGVDYDTWVESWDDVVDYVATLEVRWPEHSGTLPTTSTRS